MPDHPYAWRLALLFLTLMLTWQAPGPAVAQDSCGSFAVAVAPQPAGHPLADNVVRLVDARGELLSVEFAQPHTVLASPKPGVALLRSLSGLTSILDVATGVVTPLQMPPDAQIRAEVEGASIRNAPIADYMLLATPPDTVWLVDLENGASVDLRTFMPNSDPVDAAAISPDGKWLLFSGGSAAYLASLETLGEPGPLESGLILPGADFTRDSSAVIYAVQAGDGSASVRSLDLASNARTDLRRADGAQMIDLNDGGPLLAITDDSILALRDGATSFEPIYEWRGEPARIISDTGGRHLLVGDSQADVVSNIWIDTGTGESREIPELQGMRLVSTNDAPQNFILFDPAGEGQPGAPGSSYVILDMSTGALSTPLTQDSSEVWTASMANDDAGRYALVNAVSPGSGRMWLIDLWSGTTTWIGTSTGNVSASVSPDGCQLALDIFDTVGEGRTSVVQVTAMDDGSAIASLPDSLLLGWAQTSGSG